MPGLDRRLWKRGVDGLAKLREEKQGDEAVLACGRNEANRKGGFGQDYVGGEVEAEAVPARDPNDRHGIDVDERGRMCDAWLLRHEHDALALANRG